MLKKPIASSLIFHCQQHNSFNLLMKLTVPSCLWTMETLYLNYFILLRSPRMFSPNSPSFVQALMSGGSSAEMGRYLRMLVSGYGWDQGAHRISDGLSRLHSFLTDRTGQSFIFLPPGTKKMQWYLLFPCLIQVPNEAFSPLFLSLLLLHPGLPLSTKLYAWYFLG